MGDCLLHYHSYDRVPTHDTLSSLQAVANTKTVVGAYSIEPSDDYVLCDGTVTITMPLSKSDGRELECVLVTPGTLTIVPSGADTLLGDTSVVAIDQWTALRFRAVSGGWILI